VIASAPVSSSALDRDGIFTLSRVRVWRRSDCAPNEHRGQSYFTLYGHLPDSMLALPSTARSVDYGCRFRDSLDDRYPPPTGVRMSEVECGAIGRCHRPPPLRGVPRSEAMLSADAVEGEIRLTAMLVGAQFRAPPDPDPPRG